MKYVLLQWPTTGEIVIIDNSTKIGKEKVTKLCNEGAVPAGTIESDLNRLRIDSGLRYKSEIKYADAIAKLYKIKRFVEDI
mgnify:CR=1 FL=1|jgi:hypothetical protein